MLAHIADGYIPLSWFVPDLHREALEEHLDSIDESLQIKSNIRSDRLNQEINRLH